MCPYTAIYLVLWRHIYNQPGRGWTLAPWNAGRAARRREDAQISGAKVLQTLRLGLLKLLQNLRPLCYIYVFSYRCCRCFRGLERLRLVLLKLLQNLRPLFKYALLVSFADARMTALAYVVFIRRTLPQVFSYMHLMYIHVSIYSLYTWYIRNII